MVMHARKTQRMNDGYFEKHQAHPYQNSKYGSSKSYGSSSDRYERIRDSPNGNYRSDSPDSQSSRDRDRERSYQSKGSYLQKIREKERENRDYKLSRDKYSDCVRSPKDKRSRELEHRTNNDRNEDKGILHPIKMSQNMSRDRKPIHNNSVDKMRFKRKSLKFQRDDRDRVIRVGDWSEHVSSSGKKYYYNCKTEVSQWEKPREWMDRERDRYRNRDRERDRDSDRCYGRSGGMRHDKHSNSRGANSSKDCIRESATVSRHWSTSSSSREDSDNTSKECRTLRKHNLEENLQSTQDMDISPGDSTPTSEISYKSSSQQHILMNNDANNIGPVLLANALPRLISHPNHSIHNMPSTPGRSESSPQNIVAATTVSIAGVGNAVMSIPNSIITSNAPGPPSSRINLSQNLQIIDNDKNLHGLSRQNVTIGDSVVHSSLSVDTNNHTITLVEGPPTPTHSEIIDCSKLVSVPVSSPSTNYSTLQGMSSSLQALRPQGPTITPSLVNYYRDDLVNHVRGWPAEILEKQANKLADEAHIMGSIQCSKISAELKSARSLVRLTEIQATLQEQRILFLRQQIKELEELKSQNSFMSDDS